MALSALFAPKWVPAAALAVILVQLGLLVSLSTLRAPDGGGVISRGLDDFPTHLVLVLTPNAKVSDVTALLKDLRAEIVGGPDADGAYVIGVRTDKPALINEKLKARPVRQWIAALDAEGVPCGPINSIADMAADPQALAREMVVELDHPRAGATRALGLPIKLSASPGKVVRPAPLLGQHTREVLAEFGFSASEIEALVNSGAAVSA